MTTILWLIWLTGAFQMSQTQLESHEQAKEYAATHRAMCLALLKTVGPLSSVEISEALKLELYTVRPRLTELLQTGQIKIWTHGWNAKTKRWINVYVAREGTAP